VAGFPDGKSALMMAAARLPQVAATKCGALGYATPSGAERSGMNTRADTFAPSLGGAKHHTHQTYGADSVRKALDTTAGIEEQFSLR
jgi:hypothetical protein